MKGVQAPPEHAASFARGAARLLDLGADAIVYQDDSIVVVDKPAGIPCQSPDASQPEDLVSLLKRRLAQQRGCSEQAVYLGTHQRLDQETSGVLVYSLDKVANAPLSEQFESRSVDKQYLAAVSGRPPAPGSVLESYLVPDEAGLMRVGKAGQRGAKHARTRVVAVERHGDRSLLTLAIETGRTHQIRVQLASVGCPIAGDVLYGGVRAVRMLLHAQRVRLTHPVTAEPLQVEARPPYELGAWLAGVEDPFAEPRLLGRIVELAFGRRLSLLRAYEAGQTSAFRALHGEADGLPDVYIDVFDRFVVVRVDGDEREAEERALLATLRGLGFAGAYVKRHPRQANRMVDPRDPVFAPSDPAFGERAPDPLVVYERAVPYETRLAEGLRTGLFLDQRDNRTLVQALARDGRMLNLFGYTGSFSVAALVGGAREAVTVDVSRAALAWAKRNVRLAVGDDAPHRVMAEDAFVALRALAAKDQLFDVVVLDPPSYSTSKHGRFQVAKDYTALCAATFRVMRPGGVLIACVNHHGLTRGTLRRFIQVAGAEVGVTFESVRDLPTQRDFPVTGRGEPAMKSILVRLTAGPRMRSASGHMSQGKRSG